MSLELFCVGRRNDFAKFEEKTVYALTARENILYKHKIKRNKTTTLDRFLDSGQIDYIFFIYLWYYSIII